MVSKLALTLRTNLSVADSCLESTSCLGVNIVVYWVMYFLNIELRAERQLMTLLAP
jgi:hypothetical protein